MLINYIKNYLQKDDLDKIQEAITGIENETSGEIRLCLKLRRNFREKKLSARETAVAEFFNLGIEKTKDGTGVLIYILFRERLFEIVADKNIYEKIDKSKFDSIVQDMSSEFKNGNYLNGIIRCIGEIGNVMKKEFPRKPDDINELPDEIIIK